MVGIFGGFGTCLVSPQVNAGRVDPRLLSAAWQVPHEAGTRQQSGRCFGFWKI